MFKIKGIMLKQEHFENYSDILEPSSDLALSSTLGINSALGINSLDDNILVQKVIVDLTQTLASNVFSRLETEHLVAFDVTDAQLNLTELAEDISKGVSSEQIEDLSNALFKSSYPYIREHIEYTYKKANIQIDIPFEI